MLEQVVCPTNCGTSLPPVQFDPCTFDWRTSAIDQIAITQPDATPFTAVEDETEWAARLDQTVLTAGKIRLLHGVGTVNAPADVVITKGQKTRITKRNRSITFTINEMNDKNYDFVRAIECGGQRFQLWYFSNDGVDGFGGVAGIPVSATGTFVYGPNDGDILEATITFTWSALQSPPRFVSPIAST